MVKCYKNLLIINENERMDFSKESKIEILDKKVLFQGN